MKIDISVCNSEVQEKLVKVVAVDLANRCSKKWSKCPLPANSDCPIDVLDCHTVEAIDWIEYLEKRETGNV